MYVSPWWIVIGVCGLLVGFALALCAYGVLMWLWKLVTDSNRGLIKDFAALQKETDEIVESVNKTAEMFRIVYEVENTEKVTRDNGYFQSNIYCHSGFMMDRYTPIGLRHNYKRETVTSSNTDCVPESARIISVTPLEE